LPGVIAELEARGINDTSYWVCAFSVNQHSGICGHSRDTDVDAVTGVQHATCVCATEKVFSGVASEMNKFDDMMGFIADRSPDFRQVVAVDTHFALFQRAWCVAELVKARQLGITQRMVLHSDRKLQRWWRQLENIKVQKCHASRPEDKALILSKIPSYTAFNKELRRLILGSMQQWLDATEQADHLGRIVWSLQASELELRGVGPFNWLWRLFKMWVSW